MSDESNVTPESKPEFDPRYGLIGKKQRPQIPTVVKVILGFFGALILVGFIIGFTSKPESNLSVVTTSTDQSTSSSQIETASADSGTSRSFHLDSVTFKDLSAFGGALARVTNISDSTKTALMGITIYGPDDTTPIQNLVGTAEAVPPGQTVTVQFVGTDPLPDGEFTYDFQVSMEM